LIVDRGCGELIKHTVSCTRTYEMTKLYTHCGCCSQCLDRRFAVLAANAAGHDPVEMYRVELLAGARDKPNDQTSESYVRTALELREMSELAFFGWFSGETARVRDGFPLLTADEVGRQVLNLHKRHAQAIGEVLKAGIERHSAELINRSLSSSSVLMMTVVPGGAPALAPIGKRADAIKMWIDEAEFESASGGERGDAFVPDQSTAARTHEPSRTGRRKSKPALERARGAIKDLYPNGVPGQAVEPNPVLCRRVGDKLKQSGLRDVSDDTILRAAGRRK
jgi:hypothetical protein